MNLSNLFLERQSSMKIVIPGLDTDTFGSEFLSMILDLCKWADKHCVTLYSDCPIKHKDWKEYWEKWNNEFGEWVRTPKENE